MDANVSLQPSLPYFRRRQHRPLQRRAVKELGVTTVQWAVLGALSDPRPTYGMSVGTLADSSSSAGKTSTASSSVSSATVWWRE